MWNFTQLLLAGMDIRCAGDLIVLLMHWICHFCLPLISSNG